MEKKLETINIKGKAYVTVNERLKAFRTSAEFAGWQLVTKLHQLDDNVCVMEAQIINKEGVIVANGFARELRTQSGSMVNATSYVENCETSAWGRALGNIGIGIDQAICSAQELLYALGQQNKPADERKPAKSVIIPKKDEQAAEQAKKPAEEREWTQGEIDEYDQACADMDAAETPEQVKSIYLMYKDAIFGSKLKQHSIAVATLKGWIK